MLGPHRKLQFCWFFVFSGETAVCTKRMINITNAIENVLVLLYGVFSVHIEVFSNKLGIYITKQILERQLTGKKKNQTVSLYNDNRGRSILSYSIA